MSDALYEMKDAPRPPHGRAPEIYAFGKVGSACVAWGIGPHNRSRKRYEKAWANGGSWHPDSAFTGYLPLPADASSPSVAKTAGEWLAVCQPGDAAENILRVLSRMDDEDAIRRVRRGLRFIGKDQPNDPS